MLDAPCDSKLTVTKHLWQCLLYIKLYFNTTTASGLGDTSQFLSGHLLHSYSRLGLLVLQIREPLGVTRAGFYRPDVILVIQQQCESIEGSLLFDDFSNFFH